MELKLYLCLFLLTFIIQENKAGKYGSKSSGGSRSGGSRSGGSKSGSSWGSGKKTNTNTGRSYSSPRPQQTIHRVEHRNQPSAPNFEEPRKPVYSQTSYSKPSSVPSKPVNNNNNNNNNNNYYYNYKTTSSAPKLGGSFGTYYDGKAPSRSQPVTQRTIYHAPATQRTEYRTQPSAPKFEDPRKPVQPNYNTNNWGSGRKESIVTPKPYIPTSILKPTKYSPPYPSGSPQGLHPLPHNTGISGSSIGASKYPQVSQPAYNPHYPTNTGNFYPQSGSHPSAPVSYPTYPSGTHSYSGSYGNQGHSSYPQSAPYLQQAGYPVNTGGYHPSHPSGGSSFSQPGVVYVPSAVSTSRGTGDIIKEALIHSTINAGVNAAANRIFYPSHFSGNNYASGYGSGGYNSGGYGGGYDHTYVTHNNYYYNQPPSVPRGVDNLNSFTADTSTVQPDNLGSGSTPNINSQGFNNQAIGGNQPAMNTQPSGKSQPSGINNGNGSSGTFTKDGPNNPNTNNPNVNNPDINNPNLNNYNNNQPINANPSNVPSSNPPQMVISDDELRSLTEDLFSRQEFDVNKYIKLNLQKKVNSTNIADESPEPLLEVEPEVNTIPTIELIKMLYDNYEYNSQVKEEVTLEKIKEQNDLLEVILQTNVISGLMKWLTDKNYIAPDDLSKKEILTRIWFTLIEGSTSAFERTFLAENYWNTSIMGFQNWIYFNHAESKKELNYMGYMDKLDFGNKGSLLKVVIKANEIVQPTSVFVGTLPELEMALYTVCFYARPNGLCPVSLGGAKFNIFTHTYHSWGKDFLDVAVPDL